jgi:hypothetical protein
MTRLECSKFNPVPETSATSGCNLLTEYGVTQLMVEYWRYPAHSGRFEKLLGYHNTMSADIA